MILFSQFATAIYELAFPEGRGEFQVPMIRNMLVNGLIQLSTYLESLKMANVNFFDKDNVFDDCGLSIIPHCRGEITSVYAFKPSCRCDRFFYDGVSMEKVSCLSERCKCMAQCSTVPANTFNSAYCGYEISGELSCEAPYLVDGFEDDCNFKLSDKYFAVGPQSKVYLFPRFPCGYVVGIHWKGIKRQYLDGDYVLDDQDIKDCIAAYVQAEYALRVDNDQQRYAALYAKYREKASDIIHREDLELRPRVRRMCVSGLDTSELINIYGMNPYPTEVGECDQKKTEPVTNGDGNGGGGETPFCDDTDTLFWWPFEEATDAARVDVVHGIPMWPTAFGSVLTEQATGKVNNGVHFVPSINANIGLVTALDDVAGATGGGLFTELAYPGIGGLDFMIWMKIDDEVDNMQPIPIDFRMYDADENQIGRLYLDFLWGTNVRVGCSNETDSITFDSPVIPDSSQWHAWRVFYDPSDSKVGVQIDGGTIYKSDDTISMPASVTGKLLVFELGTGGDGTQTDFTVDELVARIGSMFSDDEITTYYNDGVGLTYPCSE